MVRSTLRPSHARPDAGFIAHRQQVPAVLATSGVCDPREQLLMHLLLNRRLTRLQVLAYFAYIIPIWTNAPKATHSQVWLEFSNEGGWNGLVLPVLIGQLSGIGTGLGIDTVRLVLSPRSILMLTLVQAAHM
jgi:hypothetical protein